MIRNVFLASGVFVLAGSALAQQIPPQNPPLPPLSAPSEAAVQAVTKMVQQEVNHQLLELKAPLKSAVEPVKPTIVEVAAPPPPPPTALQQIALAAIPVVGAILVPLVGWGLLLYKKHIGIKLTEQEEAEMAKHKAAIYNAVQTGAGDFFTHLANGTAKLSDAQSSSPLIQSIAADARASVPEAVAAVGTSQNQMARIINGAVGRAISTDTTIPTTPILAVGSPTSSPTTPPTSSPPRPVSVGAPQTAVTPQIAVTPQTTSISALLDRITAVIAAALEKGQAVMAATLNDIQIALAAMQPGINALTATINVDVIPLLHKLAAGQGNQIDPVAVQMVVDALNTSTTVMTKLHDDLAQAVIETSPPLPVP